MTSKKKFFLSFVTRHLSLVAVLLALCAGKASALPLIRDAEIEHTLREMSAPIFRAADLNPENVRIFIVQSKTINAFVAGGSNIFIHTGLLEQMNNPGMLMGVIAHETGHIAGGHLARGSEQLRGAQMGLILSYVLGAAAAVSGSADASMAVLSGGQQVVERNLLSFSRGNENSADQAALNYLDKLGVSATGMLSTFELLRRNEHRQFGSPDPYILTHPLSAARVEHMRAHVEKSSVAEGTWPNKHELPLKRLRAKLYSFLELPPKTFARYPAGDKSVPARMARAIAWYKIPELSKALAEVDSLIAENPKDPFFHDLKGQILFENGRVRDALASYEKAVALEPDSALLLTSLGEVRLAQRDSAQTHRAVADLERAAHLDNSNASTWRFLATAQGMLGNRGLSHLALAEEAALRMDPDTTRREADLALAALPAASPASLRAEDLKRVADALRDAADDAG